MTKSLYGRHGPFISQAAGQLSAPRPSALRHFAATVLRQASRLLARMARRLAAPAPRASVTSPPVLEFYAEAGASEGALYLDGQLIVRLPGVTRL